MIYRPQKRLRLAFTLVELLIATTILSLLVVFTASLLSAVSNTWVSSEQQVETFQGGRAILNLIAQDLSQAVISDRLQFIQTADPSSLARLLPSGTVQVANSDSLFWQGIVASDSFGNINEIGYYLTQRTDSSGIEHFELKRFFVPPQNPYLPSGSPPAQNPAYHLFDPFAVIYNTSSSGIMPPWLNLSGTNLDPSHLRTDFDYSSSIVSDGVLGLWIRCIDRNGGFIPWLSTADSAASPIRFNSTAHFQPAVPGQSFAYTDPASTAQANCLPSAVEVTILILDSRTLQRKPSIPPIRAFNSPDEIPGSITALGQDLATDNIRSFRTFSTRVELPSRVNK